MKMRMMILATLLLIVALVPGAMAGDRHSHHSIDHDGFQMDFDGSTLVLKNHDRRSEVVEITKDYELYVDGDRIETDRKEQKLLKAYYQRAEHVEEVAMELGREGARLGVQGAALGVTAVAKVLKMLDDDYDSDDFEAEIEAEAEAIEREAEGIEEAAEELEEEVDVMREIGDELQERIPELEELEWF